MKTAIIGCGNISTQYLERAPDFGVLDIVRVADLDAGRARAQADKFGVPRHGGVDDLINDAEVELVINLTIPAAHAPVALKCIAAGKHVYGEKPLAVTREDAASMIDAAAKKGVRVGNAPDTFLGTGHQAARKLIDDGAIGTPTAAMGLMVCPGHESWHPDPEFYYAAGGGPMLDMGPYYLTALMNLLGPINRVSAEAGIQITPRIIGSEKKRGQVMHVEVPDHVTTSLRFAGGAIGTMVTSFAGHQATHDTKYPITIYGTEGTLKVGDPNHFDIPPLLYTTGQDGDDYAEAATPHVHPNGRSLGVADMALAIQADRPHRASGELSRSVLDIMVGALESSERGEFVTIDTAGVERPAMMDLAGMG